MPCAAVPASCDSETPRSRTPRASRRARGAHGRSRGTTVLTSVARELAVSACGLEVGEADLQRDRARVEPGVPQPRARRDRPAARARVRMRRGAEVDRRTSPRRRSTWRPVRGRPRAGRRCARGCSARPRRRAERAHERRFGERGDLADVRTPMRSSARVAGPTPQSRDTGSGARNSRSVPGCDDQHAVGLREIARELGQELRGRDADRPREPGSACTRARISGRDLGPVPSRRRAPATSRNASSSEIGSTSGVTDRGSPSPRGSSRCRRRTAARGTRRAGRRAGARHRHRGAHAERARLVARGATTPRRRDRRRPRAGPAASDRRAARPTRRTRRGRRAGCVASSAHLSAGPRTT